jgi:hypothetical protein
MGRRTRSGTYPNCETLCYWRGATTTTCLAERARARDRLCSMRGQRKGVRIPEEAKIGRRRVPWGLPGGEASSTREENSATAKLHIFVYFSMSIARRETDGESIIESLP